MDSSLMIWPDKVEVLQLLPGVWLEQWVDGDEIGQPGRGPSYKSVQSVRRRQLRKDKLWGAPTRAEVIGRR